MQEFLASVPSTQLVPGDHVSSLVSEPTQRPVKKNEKHNSKQKVPKDTTATKSPSTHEDNANTGSNSVPVVTTITLAPTGSNIPEMQVDTVKVSANKKPPAKKKAPVAAGPKPNAEKQDKDKNHVPLQQNETKTSRPKQENKHENKSAKTNNAEKTQDNKNKKKPRENKGNNRMHNDLPVQPPRRASPSPPHVPSKEAATRLFAALSEYSSETRTSFPTEFSSSSLTLEQGVLRFWSPSIHVL